jgi:hypothetical protein
MTREEEEKRREKGAELYVLKEEIKLYDEMTRGAKDINLVLVCQSKKLTALKKIKELNES